MQKYNLQQTHKLPYQPMINCKNTQRNTKQYKQELSYCWDSCTSQIVAFG